MEYKEMTRSLVAAILLALALMVALPSPAAADPPTRDPYLIINRGQIVTTTTTKLPHSQDIRANPRITPNASTQTDLGGGVTATSASGLQWQESFCCRWVWGITQST